MKMYKKLLVGTALVIAAPNAAQAAVTIDILQTGADVVGTVSGSLDLTGLISQGTIGNAFGVRGNVGFIGTGGNGNLDSYTGFSGTTSIWGTSTTVIGATSGTGDLFAFNSNFSGSPRIFVPVGYTSNSVLASTATFAGQTLASLGLSQGTYVYTAGGETVTVNIGAMGAVPEPATWAFMIFGFGAVGGAMRSRRKTVTKVSFA